MRFFIKQFVIFKTLFNKLIIEYDYYRFRNEWRRLNHHNETVAKSKFSISKVKVGMGTYGTIDILNHTDSNEKLYIGCFCSIAPNVQFILGSDHLYHTISTFPFKVKIFGEQFEAISKGDIVICDDVWIGYGSIILSGVTINQGAIIAAGSVVTKDVPHYAIVGGNPAKIIKFRFEESIIEKLMKIDFSEFNNNLIVNNIDDLYKKVDSSNIEHLLNVFGKRINPK